MMPRILFAVIAVFWVVMNVLLWRTEFGSYGGQISVPPQLVWQKVLTAPDASALTIYQNGHRIGFCEFSTSVERAMAAMDDDNPPPEGLVSKNGYKIHVDGNVSLGDITNRMRFDGFLQFSSAKTWREIYLRLTVRGRGVEVHSLAAEKTVNFQVFNDGGHFERVITFADLQNPNALLNQLGGAADGSPLGYLELPVLPSSLAGEGLHWEARRDRMLIGHEPVSTYRLETQVLGNPVVIYTSSLGEILRVELPGGVTAALDEWTKQ